MSKLLLGILLLLFFTESFSQRVDWRFRIDQKVEEADSLSLKSQKVFYLHKFLKDRPIKETWYYTLRQGNVVIFEVKYVVDSVEHSEIYYLDKGRLICMEQYEVPYLSVYADEVKRGAAYFFDNDNLRQYVITGKVPGDVHIGSAFKLLSRFEKRFSELQETLTLQR